ncbi:MAG: hypothetical protein ACRCT8_06510 [Lacipirellulaceae bacterium]
MRSAAMAVVMILGAACPALAADGAKHLLRYKLRPGEVLRYEVDQRSSVRNTMEGTTQEAQTKTVSLKAWKVIDVMPNGEIEFINLVERVRMENKLPDRAAMVYDSTQKQPAPPGFEDAARAVGTPLSSVRMTPWGAVKSRKVKHHQPAADPHESIVVPLPKDAIAIGDVWTAPQKVTVNMPEGGPKSLEAQRKFTLASVENGIATIDADFQVLSPTTPAMDGQLAHRAAKGTIRFDLARGRVVSQQLDVDRRVLGFAGPSSSMHLVTRMEEKLADGPASVASRK